MRNGRLTGTVLLVFVLFTIQLAIAAELKDDAVTLIGGTDKPDNSFLSDTLDSTSDYTPDADASSANDQHPVYHLRPEPFSDADALTLGLDELLELAVENNLGLARQHYTIEKNHYSVDQTYYAFDPTWSGSLSYSHSPGAAAGQQVVGSRDSYSFSTAYSVPSEYGDGFQFSYTASSLGSLSSSTTTKSGAFSVGYNRPLARGAGKYFNRIGRFISSNSLLLSYDKLDDDVRNLKKQVLDAYYLAVSARQAITVREANLDVALKQLERSVERYKVGMAIRTELLQAENSVLMQRNALLDAQKSYEDLLDSLTLLLGLPNEIQLAVNGTNVLIALSSELPADLWELVLCNSYDLKSINTQINNLRLSRDQQLHQLKPDINLGLNYERSNTDNNAGRAYTDLNNDSYGATLSWNATPGKRAARAGLAQTELDLASLDLSIQELELSLKARLRELERGLTTRYQQTKLAESNLEVVSETLTIQQERHDVGLAITLDVVEAQERVLEAELALLSAQVSYQQAYRELQLMAGLI